MSPMINRGRYQRTYLAARKHDVHFAFGAFQQSRGFVSRQTTETDRITQSVKFDSIKECFNEG